jgi:hypothetical protein
VTMDQPFSHTHARILKLHAKGLNCESIAKKLGRPGEVERVHDALKEANRRCECLGVTK